MTEHVCISKAHSSPHLFSVAFIVVLQNTPTLDQVWHTRSQSKSEQNRFDLPFRVKHL